MNKKVSLMILSILLTPLCTAYGEVNIDLSQLIKDITLEAVNDTDHLDTINRRFREPRVNEIKDLQQQLVELGKRRDAGKIGRQEFEQTSSMLTKRLERLNKEIETHDLDSSAARSIVTNGLNALVEMAKDEQKRNNQLVLITAEKAADNKGKKEQLKMQLDAALEKLKFMSKPENLTNYALFGAATTAGIAATYYLFKFLYHYLEQRILEKRPTLVEETSYQGRLDGIKASLAKLLGYAPAPVTLKDNIVFEPNLEQQLTSLANSAELLHERSLPMPSIILYGEPGTGKTHFAKLMAKISNLDYAITSADRWSQLPEGKDVEAIHELFDWAERSQRGMILFIDEIDALAGNRDKMSDRWVRLLNAFLARTGTSSAKVTIIAATNRLHALDSAFLDRFAQKIHIPLPGPVERERLLNLYLKKYIIDDVRTITKDKASVELRCNLSTDIDNTFIKYLAEHTNGFSGRRIEQLVNTFRNQCHLTPDLQLTRAMCTKALSEMMPT